MTNSTHDRTLPSDAVQDIEKRMRWSASATAGFLFMMVSLLVVAALAIFAPPRTAQGLPQTPDVLRARALLHDQVLMVGADLRFRSALTGEWDPTAGVPEGQHQRLVDARRLLSAAARDLPLDARTHTALGHIELGLRDAVPAELRYRLALELTPLYAEAHLGLGMALMQRARLASNVHQRRRLMLQAAARFAAIQDSDPLHDCALHNRAIVLLELGYAEKASALAREALDREPTGPWASVLRTAFGWDS